jgi:hypothetical protein
VQKKRQDFSLAFKMANRLIDKGINLDASIWKVWLKVWKRRLTEELVNGKQVTRKKSGLRIYVDKRPMDYLQLGSIRSQFELVPFDAWMNIGRISDLLTLFRFANRKVWLCFHCASPLSLNTELRIWSDWFTAGMERFRQVKFLLRYYKWQNLFLKSLRIFSCWRYWSFPPFCISAPTGIRFCINACHHNTLLRPILVLIALPLIWSHSDRKYLCESIDVDHRKRDLRHILYTDLVDVLVAALWCSLMTWFDLSEPIDTKLAANVS